MNETSGVRIHYFTDVLCIWAYLAQIRLDELIKNYSSKIDVTYHFMPVFGHTENRIKKGWKDKGGFDAFSKHMHKVIKDFPHVELHEDIWKKNIPKTSTTSHLFIKAVQYLVNNDTISNECREDCGQQTLLEEFIWQVRLAFFRDLRDISQIRELFDIAKTMNLPINKIQEVLDDGSALAELSRDIELKDEFNVDGSPTYILNEGRQKLYGNVGYRIIEANLLEILKQPDMEASWC
jgi:predicted DsbA family dithiol-disulfide isomerase